MTFFEIAEAILIGPLKLVFECIFWIANKFIGNPGLAVIVLSLTMNFLVLPLYRRADAVQEEARDVEAKLHNGVAHIKKAFSGDERMMMLQTYYRQNHYKPTDALNGSVSLLLEIPFFMAAYQFLSHAVSLQGTSLGPITNLGSPDGLLVLGGIAINVLPILMTLINIISSALYLKGFPLKTKIQLYGMALFFLVFLYNSPAGLVFYWTLNNVFSLVKNIFYKLKNPRKVLGVLTAVVGVLILVAGLFLYDAPTLTRKLFVTGIGAVLQLPLLVMRATQKKLLHIPTCRAQPNKKLFLLGSIFLTILVGALIPSALIADSPQEFIVFGILHNPLTYVANTLCLAIGTFLVWFGVFRGLATPAGKVLFDRLIWVLCGVMLINYMFFGENPGIISADLQFEDGLVFSRQEKLINLLVILAAVVLLYVCIVKWRQIAMPVLLTAIIALSGMSGMNAFRINEIVQQTDFKSLEESVSPEFRLSKNGKNVVVLMLDRAMNQYIPYLFNEKPELKEQFAGFTYYANTISFGGYTNFATPPLFGGYEYTPVEMNRRDTELLVDKHNEALRMLPVLFDENGYEVSAFDLPYANYQWIPDMSIFDEYPDIRTGLTDGAFLDDENKTLNVLSRKRNFFCYSVMKTLPLFTQFIVYDSGFYNQDAGGISTQTQKTLSEATGKREAFMSAYTVLTHLSAMTQVVEEDINTCMIMGNNTTHEPMLLQAPDYIPASEVDNTAYNAAHANRFVLDGKRMETNTITQMIHYHANMATMLRLGEWFDYLRENNVYDNTRIILVADHGRNLNQFEELIRDDGTDFFKDVELYYPLLMVKDFESEEFTTSNTFMTNADVPTIAVGGLIPEAKNPFTGKTIHSAEKTVHDQYVILSNDINLSENNGTTYLPARWASVRENLWDRENWTFWEDEIVLKEHIAPQT